MNENNEQKKNKYSLIYAIIGVAVLIIAVSGSAYAYYAASATKTFSGSAAGGGVELTVTKVNVGTGTGNLIPIDGTAATLTKAAKGYVNNAGATPNTAWNANNACIDKKGYNVCHIYSVKIKNSSSTAVKYNIGVTRLCGNNSTNTTGSDCGNNNNTPNVDVVKMASNISVTDATSIKGSSSGISRVNTEDAISVPANNGEQLFYIMVFIKNLDSVQPDNGAFTGTVTAVSTSGENLKADFS